MSRRVLAKARQRGAATRAEGYAVSAKFDRRRRIVTVDLNTGVSLTFSPDLAQGLAGASVRDLSEIEISSAGLGLHWPRLDADLYVPGLLRGTFGSKGFVAKRLGAAAGRVTMRLDGRNWRTNDMIKHILPPDGYESWLDYALDTFDTRSIWLESLFKGEENPPDRETIRNAAREELQALRAQARTERG